MEFICRFVLTAGGRSSVHIPQSRHKSKPVGTDDSGGDGFDDCFYLHTRNDVWVRINPASCCNNVGST